MTTDEDPLGAQREAYRDQFLAHGDSPEGTFQNLATQRIRFETLTKTLAPHFRDGQTLHDIGSGLCDFYGYMRETGLHRLLTYSGTEIVEDMNVKARAKYPEVQLVNRDFLSAPDDERYDYLVLSGTLNMLWGSEPEAWQKYCLSLIERMYRSARVAVAFNVLTSYRTFSDPNLSYFDPREIFDFATTYLSRFVTLDASYPLYEVTITVLRKDYMAARYNAPELAKYFR